VPDAAEKHGQDQMAKENLRHGQLDRHARGWAGDKAGLGTRQAAAERRGWAWGSGDAVMGPLTPRAP